MTIYLDIVLLENIVMNYIILKTTALIYKTKTKFIKTFAASIIGGIYAVVSFIRILPIYSSIWLKILLSVCMVYISYSPKNIKVLIKQLLLFYLISFAFGGIAFALLYFVRPQDIFMKNGLFIGTYPLKIVFLGGIIGFALIVTAFKAVKGKLSKKDMFCKILFEIQGKQKELTAMIDTGNLLIEPITKKPVVVIEGSSLNEILPSNILENIEEIMSGKMLELR